MSFHPQPLYTILATMAMTASAVLAVPPAPATLHLRGTILSRQGQTLSILSSTGTVRVLLTAKTPVVSVVPSSRAQIKDGAFLGIASVPGAGGMQRAREVVVFPEAARGSGEGSYAWDLPGGAAAGRSRMTNGTALHSKMTNGTAAQSRMTNGTARKSGGGASLTLQYKSGTGTGSQIITLPPDIPMVTFAPGQLSQLLPGAHVFVAGHRQAGAFAADRVLVGKNGLVPPM